MSPRNELVKSATPAAVSKMSGATNRRDAPVAARPLAPASVTIIPINWNEGALRQAAETLYTNLITAGVDVLLDDRDERPGVKFKDADLLGIPWRVTIGAKPLARGVVELKRRTDAQSTEVPLDAVATGLVALSRGEATP